MSADILTDIAARHPRPDAPLVEWMSFRIEAHRAPTADDIETFRPAVQAGMDAMRNAFSDAARKTVDVVPTMTVYPLTQCADAHAELVAALREVSHHIVFDDEGDLSRAEFDALVARAVAVLAKEAA